MYAQSICNLLGKLLAAAAIIGLIVTAAQWM